MARVPWWLWLLPVGVVAVMICDSNDPTETPLPPTPRDPGIPAPVGRAAVRVSALSQLGNGDPAVYWADVMPGVDPTGMDWCGAFALWNLHQAGLALDRHWKMGAGFILVGQHPLPVTKDPQIGDIAYFTHNQHEAVVVGVDADSVQLVNGNGAGGVVSASTVKKNAVTAFYSIAPLLAEAGLANV